MFQSSNTPISAVHTDRCTRVGSPRLVGTASWAVVVPGGRRIMGGSAVSERSERIMSQRASRMPELSVSEVEA